MCFFSSARRELCFSLSTRRDMCFFSSEILSCASLRPRTVSCASVRNGLSCAYLRTGRRYISLYYIGVSVKMGTDPLHSPRLPLYFLPLNSFNFYVILKRVSPPPPTTPLHIPSTFPPPRPPHTPPPTHPHSTLRHYI